VVLAAYVGEPDNITLTGKGFSASEKDATPSGMPALFITGKNFSDGRVLITVDGFGKGPLKIVTVLATILCFLVLGLGFTLWIKRRFRKDPDFLE
jgi:hypothetical protein